MKLSFHESGDFIKNEVTFKINMDHKQWLDNEYAQWIEALQESTVHNFKEHPMVKRMLGQPSSAFWLNQFPDEVQDMELLFKIDAIGREITEPKLSGGAARMIYYANEILKLNPSSICEIGGGVGQFYAILRALGWRGEYYISDLHEVKEFQYKYLAEVENVTGLNLKQTIQGYDMLVSFYALGEFDDESRMRYKNLINETNHGYIAWNVHSGATDDKSIFCTHEINVRPGLESGIEIIEW